MGDNSELGFSGIFCGVLLIAGRAHLQNIEDSSSAGLKIELLFCIRATKVKFFTPWYFHNIICIWIWWVCDILHITRSDSWSERKSVSSMCVRLHSLRRCKGSFTLYLFCWLRLRFFLWVVQDSMEVFTLCDCDNIINSLCNSCIISKKQIAVENRKKSQCERALNRKTSPLTQRHFKIWRWR